MEEREDNVNTLTHENLCGVNGMDGIEDEL